MSDSYFGAFEDRACETCGRAFRYPRPVARPGRGRFCSKGCATRAAITEKARSRVSMPFEFEGAMVCRVALTKGAFTLIDADDAPAARSRSWQLSIHGYAAGKGGTFLHRVLLDAPATSCVDHISGDRLDNRRSNLRLVSPAENGQNRRQANSNSQTGVRGVVKCGRRYVALVMVNRELVLSKSFASLDDARRAAEEARAKLHPYSREALEAVNA